MQEGFAKVRTKIDCLYDVVLKRAQEGVTMHEFVSISTGVWVQNVQIPPIVIETNNENLKTSLWKLQDLSIDINMLSTQTLVHMQRVSNQELDDRENNISGHFFRL